MKVYLSPSQQIHNKGVGDYGTEAERCQDIATRAGKLLRAAGVSVKQTPKSWEQYSGDTWLSKVAAASNAFGADAHVCIHTNAGRASARGTDAWHYPGSAKGKALAKAIYDRVVRVSGKGRGIHTEPVFYETRAAKAPVCYIELIFHTNKDDVKLVIERPDAFARAIAEGILEYGGIRAPATPEVTVTEIPKTAYPRLKNRMVQYVIRAQLDGDPVSVADCGGFSVFSVAP